MSGYCKNCGNTLCVCDMTQDEVNPTLNAFLEQEKRRAISEVLEQVVEALEAKKVKCMEQVDSDLTSVLRLAAGSHVLALKWVLELVRSFMPPTEGSADDPR